jgi:hypothetical protein
MTPEEQEAFERMKANIEQLSQLITRVDTLHPRTTPTEATRASNLTDEMQRSITAMKFQLEYISIVTRHLNLQEQFFPAPGSPVKAAHFKVGEN